MEESKKKSPLDEIDENLEDDADNLYWQGSTVLGGGQPTESCAADFYQDE